MHKEFEILMSLVLDGESAADDAVRLQKHLAVCSRCSQSWDQWRALHQLFLVAPVVTSSVDLVTGAEARISAHRQRRHRSRWVGSGLLLVWAAIFAGFWFGLAAVALWVFRNPQEVGVLASSVAQLLSGASWYLRGLTALAGNLGTPTIVLGAGVYLALTGGLVLMWSYVAAHRRPLGRGIVR